MASGISYRVTCSVFNIARSTTFDIVHRCLEATIRLTPRAIKVPEEEELLQVCRGFRLKAGNAAFYMCAGALDGCHIRTLCSPTLHDQYTNRKLFCSIQLQGLVNAKGEFIDVFAGFPGSVHDSRVTVTVEQAFGQMKVRWRIIFTKALEVSLNTGVKVIIACVIMHNICLSEGDVIHRLPRENLPRAIGHAQNDAAGEAFRNHILQLFVQNM